MSMEGWYPDPAGTPGLYRYWDGATWSAVTTADPRQPPPTAGSDAPRPPTGRVRPALLVGVLLVVAIVIVAVALGVRARPLQPNTDPPPTSTVTGWDDSSPTPTPGAPTPPVSGGPPPPLVPCPQAASPGRAEHPVDDRVYGGNLSFPRVDSFAAEVPEPRLSFASDVTQQYQPVNNNPGWIAQLAVGRLAGADGFVHGPRNTAESVLNCIVTSSLYELEDHAIRRDLRSAAITVSGRPGWLVEANISVAKAGLPFDGDHVIVVVVGDGNDFGLFFGAVPIGNEDLATVMNTTVDELRAG